ncbi:DUF3526 domain-containing protein [soil metagenome]
MLARIVRHEARLIVADPTLWALALVLAGVVGYGVVNGASWVAFQRETLSAAAEEESARYEDLQARFGSPGFDDGLNAALVGRSLGARYVSMPPGPLAALVIGQSDLYPYYFKVTTEGQQSFLGDDEIENPSHLLTGRFDLGFVIIALFPLAILALSYNLLSSEKERGTLTLLLSQPVTLQTLVLGKVLTRGLMVMVLAVGISIGGFAISGGDFSDHEGMALAGLWLAVVLAYGAFWFALAVAINALGRSSATNALALAAAWLALVAVVPALVNVLVKTLYPVPSRVELVQAIRTASNEAQSEGSRLRARYFEDHPELVGAEADYDEYAIQTLAVQEAVEASVQDVLGLYETQLRRQQSLVDRLRFLSPAIVTLEALQDVAGTGSARFRHFLDQVEAFHADWRAFFRPRILRGEPIRAEDLANLPEFRFQEESTGSVAARSAVGLAGLLTPTLIVGLLGRAALRRYPIVG